MLAAVGNFPSPLQPSLSYSLLIHAHPRQCAGVLCSVASVNMGSWPMWCWCLLLFTAGDGVCSRPRLIALTVADFFVLPPPAAAHCLVCEGVLCYVACVTWEAVLLGADCWWSNIKRQTDCPPPLQPSLFCHLLLLAPPSACPPPCRV